MSRTWTLLVAGSLLLGAASVAEAQMATRAVGSPATPYPAQIPMNVAAGHHSPSAEHGMFPSAVSYDFPLYVVPTADSWTIDGYAPRYVWPRYGVYRGVVPVQPGR